MVEAGRTYRADGPLKMCANGMHASRWAIDALAHAPGPIVCAVELRGEILHDSDKSVARERRVLWLADAARVLREFALIVATDALCEQQARGRFVDPRLMAALECWDKWLAGEATEATDEELRRAAEAANAWIASAWARRAASGAAAYAAAAATAAVSWNFNAVAAATTAAAWARRAASGAWARRAVRSAQNAVLETMLQSLRTR